MSIVDQVKNGEITIGDLVKGKKANFQYYRQGSLIYQTEDGFEFPVPISDCGESTFFNEHPAIELMRWIRKHIETIKKDNVDEEFKKSEELRLKNSIINWTDEQILEGKWKNEEK